MTQTLAGMLLHTHLGQLTCEVIAVPVAKCKDVRNEERTHLGHCYYTSSLQPLKVSKHFKIYLTHYSAHAQKV